MQNVLYNQEPQGQNVAHEYLARDASASAQPETRATVLVVDDDAQIGRLLREVLEDAGYRVVLARDGQAALALARREHPALALTDRHMPEVDGIEFVRRLRASAATRRIPVVLMSSLRPDIETLGDVPFLSKPFDVDDMLAVVERHARPPKQRQDRADRQIH